MSRDSCTILPNIQLFFFFFVYIAHFSTSWEKKSEKAVKRKRANIQDLLLCVCSVYFIDALWLFHYALTSLGVFFPEKNSIIDETISLFDISALWLS